MSIEDDELLELAELEELEQLEAMEAGQNPVEVKIANVAKVKDNQAAKMNAKVNESISWGAALFPRASKSESIGGAVGGAILDFMSLPGRASEAERELGDKAEAWFEKKTGWKGLGTYAADAMSPGRTRDPVPTRGFKESMASTEGEGMLGDFIRDPATIPSMIPGVGMAGWAAKGSKVLPWATKLAKATAIGATEGAVSGAIHQADKVAQGGEFSGKELATEAGISAAIPGGMSTLGGIAKGVNQGLGKLASELSLVSEETLRKWGTGLGKGAKELKEVSNSQHKIGGKILDAIENFDDYIPEKAIVDDAIKNMPNIELANTVKAIQSEIDKIPSNSYSGVKTKLKNLMKDVTGEKQLPDVNIRMAGSAKEGKKFDIMGQEIRGTDSNIASTSRKVKGDIIHDKDRTAKDFKNLRSFTDKMVNWGDEGSSYLNDALKNIRGVMKKDLIETAEKSGVPEYVTAMKGWSDKLKIKDDFLDELGKTSKSRKKKIGQFTSTIFGKNKEHRQKVLGDIGEILGVDFLKDAKLLQMSGEIVSEKTGRSKILPNITTGYKLAPIVAGLAAGGGNIIDKPLAVLGGTLVASLSSPAIASKVLTATDLVERGVSSVMAKELAGLTGRQITEKIRKSKKGSKK